MRERRSLHERTCFWQSTVVTMLVEPTVGYDMVLPFGLVGSLNESLEMAYLGFYIENMKGIVQVLSRCSHILGMIKIPSPSRLR